MPDHTPALAARTGDPARSLLLAGGGIRVAYQAGVLVALERAGLRFSHIDGASGGTINLAMLLSGLTPAQCCERWRSLPVRLLATPPPLGTILRGPPYPALTGSSGLRRTFAHLGIDVSRIHAARGVAGTFNLCDFQTKRAIVVEHEQIEADTLVAAVSLPMVSPAVHRRGQTYLDAVWIRDTNVGEAVARGADEIWLVWCIGNHGLYRDGQFQQYVHMIEIAANGSLFEELDRVAALNATRERPVRLHVVRPQTPLPLDPDFLLGRIDATTLSAMGFRDACRYLDERTDEGVPLDESATRMHDPVAGVAFRERLTGPPGLAAELAWEVSDLARFLAGERAGAVVGRVAHAALDGWRFARSGTFSVAAGRASARLDLGDGFALQATRRLSRFQAVELRLTHGDAVVVEGGARSSAPWRTLHARGVGSYREGAWAVGRFAGWAIGAGVREMVDRYGP